MATAGRTAEAECTAPPGLADHPIYEMAFAVVVFLAGCQKDCLDSALEKI